MDDIQDYNATVTQLNTQIEVLESICEEKDKQIADLKKQVEDLQNQLGDTVLRASQLLDIVEENVKAMSYSRSMKTKERKSGENATAFRHDAKTEDIIADYNAAGHIITAEMCKKYNMTMPGIRNRLKNNNAYEQKWTRQGKEG